MGTRTKNLGLYKPATTDYVNVETDLNENLDKIDEKVLPKGNITQDWDSAEKIKSKVDEKLPKGEYSGTAKDLKDDIDTKLSKGNISAEYDTAEKIVNAIKAMGDKVIVGAMLRYPYGVSIPLGYLPCDGREVNSSQYPELYNKLTSTNIKDSDLRIMSFHDIPNLTTNNQSGYIISVSSIFSSTYDGYKALDGSNSTAWVTRNGEKTGWIKIKYPNPKLISSFSIAPYSQCVKLRKVVLYGINNGIEEELFTTNLSDNLVNGKFKDFVVQLKEKTYQEFRLAITNDASDPYCGITELKIFTCDISAVVPLDDKGNPQVIGKKYLPTDRIGVSIDKNGHNSNGYYRVYSDGYIEQWGKGYASGGGATVILPISMNNNIYNVSANAESNHWPGGCDIHTLTQTSFKMHFKNYENSHNQYYTGDFFWKMNGYLNSISKRNTMIIKAKNVDTSFDTISPVITEVNNKIEGNRIKIDALTNRLNTYIPVWG